MSTHELGSPSDRVFLPEATEREFSDMIAELITGKDSEGNGSAPWLRRLEGLPAEVAAENADIFNDVTQAMEED